MQVQDFVQSTSIKLKSKRQLMECIRQFYYNWYLPTDEDWTSDKYEEIRTFFGTDSLDEFANNVLEEVSDSTYDKLEKYIESVDSAYNKNNVGSAIMETSKKQKLPKYMGSLDKVKTQPEITKWVNKQSVGDYIVTQKLDGISALFYMNESECCLFTRGNGEVGQNISHLIPYLNCFQSILPFLKKKKQFPFAVRGELILPTNVKEFEHIENLRNVVNGLIHAKEQDQSKLQFVHFVSYRFYCDKMTLLDQLQFLNKNNFEIPMYIRVLSSNLTLEKLQSVQEMMVQDGNYQMDGLVVSNNVQMEDNDEIGKNPSHSVAFKLAGTAVQTLVQDIEWNVSKYGVVKPRIKVSPIKIGGARIEWVTGNNARFIVDNNIGKDSIIEIIRSGDVIPKIERIVKSTTPLLPTNVQWEWNKTNVDIILSKSNTNSSQMDSQKLLFFFQELESPNLGPKTVEKLYNCGFDTVPAILSLTSEQLINDCGYKQLSANKVLKGINNCKTKLQNIPEYLFMYVSGCFGSGFGNKKLKQIMDQYPNFQHMAETKTTSELVEMVKKVRGISSMADTFVSNFANYIEFKKSMQHLVSIEQSQSNQKTQEVKGIVVISGFRNENFERQIELKGWEVAENVTKQTNCVVFKYDSNTNKCNKARSYNIPVLTVDEFCEKLNL